MKSSFAKQYAKSLGILLMCAGASLVSVGSSAHVQAATTATFSHEGTVFASTTENGLDYELYQLKKNIFGRWPKTIPAMPSAVAKLVTTGKTPLINLSQSTLDNYMAMRFDGFISIPSDGAYMFALYSDDGSKMWIDGNLIINNDGIHSLKGKSSGWLNLTQGLHTIKVEYFEINGSQDLKVYWKSSNFAAQEVPTAVLYPKGVTPPLCTLSVNAGTDKTVTLPTSSVILEGTGTCSNTYQWSQTTGPAGAVIVSSTNPTTNVNGLTPGTYVFKLSATDAGGLTVSDDVQVTVSSTGSTSTGSTNTGSTNTGSSGSTTGTTTSGENIRPVSNAGPDQTITLPTTSVTVAGTATDADGTIAGVSWRQLSGPSTASITSFLSYTTTITNLSTPGKYVFWFTATDDGEKAMSDIIEITVLSGGSSGSGSVVNSAPTVNAGIDQTITLPVSTVSIAGTAVDNDGTVAHTTWTQLSGPSSATISNPTSLQTNIGGLTSVGVHVFRLTVTDDKGASTSDDVQVTVNPVVVAPNIAPIANAGTDQTIILPASVAVVAGTATDADGLISTVAWTQVSGPASASIGTPSQLTTSLSSLFVSGTYVFRLTVTDNKGTSSFDDVSVVVKSEPTATNVLPVVNAGADQIITLPISSINVAGSATDSDGMIASVSWTKLSGPASYTLTNGNSLNATVSNLVAGTYVFRLTVTDNKGGVVSDDMQVTVNAAVVNPPVTPPSTASALTATYYVSPNGGGDCKSKTSPCKVANVWSLVKPGETVGMLDGKYVGASSMITPPYGLSGQPGKPITIFALNEGKVDIDGQKLYQPVYLENNDWFVLKGFNAHDSGGPSYSVGVVVIKASENVKVLNAVAWNARGDANCFRSRGSTNVEFVDTAGFGTARKVYSTSQGSSGTVFTRAFASEDNSINKGPKEPFSLSYNSRGTVCQNCIASWYGQQMPKSYQLMETDGTPQPEFFDNYTWQAPQGMFSADGFDVTPDVANARVLGSIAYIKADQRYHGVPSPARDWAGPYSFEIKGFKIENSVAYIEPGSHTNIWTANLGSVGNTTTNKVKNFTMIGGDRNHISSDWQPEGVYSAANCAVTANGGSVVNPKPGTINGGANIMYRYENGVQTNIPLWPWPMNQRIIDAMAGAGFQPVDVTREIFGLCNGTMPADVAAALNASGSTGGTVTPPPPPANSVPTVNAGPNQVITLPTNSVPVAGSGGDADGYLTNILWTKVSGPSTYNIGTPNAMSTPITSMSTAGTYVFRLTVTDNAGATAYDDVQIIVNPAPTSSTGSTATGSTGGGTTGSTTTGTITGLSNFVTAAQQWLQGSATQRAALAATLQTLKDDASINWVINQVKPKPTDTAVGEIFDQKINDPEFGNKYADVGYHMYVPTHYTPTKPMGLIIALHGGGNCDDYPTEMGHLKLFDMDNEKVTGRSYWRTETDASDYILVAPMAPCGSLLPVDTASRWTVPSVAQYMKDLITHLSKRYNINPNKINVVGFSMGGIGAGEAAMTLNDRLASVLPSAWAWDIAPWSSLTDLPVYIIQGETDAYFNSPTACRPHRTAVEYSEIAYDILKNINSKSVLNIYPGGHSWDGVAESAWRNYINGKTGWIYNQVRDPYRKHVIAISKWTAHPDGGNYNVTWTAPETPKTLWVTIDKTGTNTILYDYANSNGANSCSSYTEWNSWTISADKTPVKAGRVEANILPNNQVSVTTQNVKNMTLWLDSRMDINISQPITVILNGVSSQYTCDTSLLRALESYDASDDPGMIYNCKISNIVVP